MKIYIKEQKSWSNSKLHKDRVIGVHGGYTNPELPQYQRSWYHTKNLWLKYQLLMDIIKLLKPKTQVDILDIAKPRWSKRST